MSLDAAREQLSPPADADVDDFDFTAEPDRARLLGVAMLGLPYLNAPWDDIPLRSALDTGQVASVLGSTSYPQPEIVSFAGDDPDPDQAISDPESTAVLRALDLGDRQVQGPYVRVEYSTDLPLQSPAGLMSSELLAGDIYQC